MDNVKDDKYYIEKVIGYMDFSISTLDGVTLKDFRGNQVLINAIMFAFVQISENSSKISDSFKNENCNIPWKIIKAVRNKIVHDYDVVKESIIYDTVRKDFPKCRKALLKAINTTV